MFSLDSIFVQIWNQRCLEHIMKKAVKTNHFYSTVQCKMREWKKKFQLNKISEPSCSASYIIAHVLGKSTLHGIKLNQHLTKLEIEAIDSLCSKRLTRLPIQYVIEEWDFGELTLNMKPPVFIPRPETQGLVDAVIDDVNSSICTKFNLLEVGCGSGAITLALLKACNQGQIDKELVCTAIDKDKNAIELTKCNASLTNLLNFQLKHCDVASLALRHQYDGIVSNPPYIPTKDMKNLQPEILNFESTSALDGGSDGLDVIKKILEVSENILAADGWIWLEVDTTHPFILKNKLKKFRLAEVKKDLFGRERFVKLIRRI